MKFDLFSFRRDGLRMRQQVEERAAVDAIDGAIVEHVAVDHDYSGPIDEPMPDDLAIGGEAEWAWREWIWFGEVAA